MFTKIFSEKIIKFFIGGGLTTCFNLALIFLLIDLWGWNTTLLHNLANALSIELSVLLSFFIYRFWVWNEEEWEVKQILFRQIPLFHLAAGSVIMARVLVIFPLLDLCNINPEINTLFGGLFGAILNYFSSDRIVFKRDLVDN